MVHQLGQTPGRWWRWGAAIQPALVSGSRRPQHGPTKVPRCPPLICGGAGLVCAPCLGPWEVGLVRVARPHAQKASLKVLCCGTLPVELGGG